MNFELLPVDQILLEIKNEPNPVVAFSNILRTAAEVFPSKIWDSFKQMDLTQDIAAAATWLNNTLDEFKDTKGIYFGLDTLNIDGGEGSNVSIGLCSTCDPAVVTDEWIYDCESYGDDHLIQGLFTVSDNFVNEQQWTDDERNFAEYVIFLGYSGIVLREALFKLDFKNDFTSIWGFHDGDMFYLVNKIDGKISVLTTIEM